MQLFSSKIINAAIHRDINASVCTLAGQRIHFFRPFAVFSPVPSPRNGEREWPFPISIRPLQIIQKIIPCTEYYEVGQKPIVPYLNYTCNYLITTITQLQGRRYGGGGGGVIVHQTNVCCPFTSVQIFWRFNFLFNSNIRPNRRVICLFRNGFSYLNLIQY